MFSAGIRAQVHKSQGFGDFGQVFGGFWGVFYKKGLVLSVFVEKLTFFRGYRSLVVIFWRVG